MYTRVSLPGEVRGFESPWSWITSGYQLPDVGPGNRTWIPCKSSMYSKLLSHLSSPQVVIIFKDTVKREAVATFCIQLEIFFLKVFFSHLLIYLFTPFPYRSQPPLSSPFSPILFLPSTSPYQRRGIRIAPNPAPPLSLHVASVLPLPLRPDKVAKEK